jgi:hypothetical protein
MTRAGVSVVVVMVEEERRVGRDRTRQDRKGKVGLDTDQVVAGKWW